MKVCLLLLSNINWQIGNGTSIEIGQDRICGFKREHSLLMDLFRKIHNLSIYYINQIVVNDYFTNPKWSQVTDIGLLGVPSYKWNRYIQDIAQVGISLNANEDKFVWVGNMVQGRLLHKEVYWYISPLSRQTKSC